MRRLALPLATAVVLGGIGLPAAAQGLPIGETTYVERSLNLGGQLTIEHPPVERNPVGRRRGNDASIAGFCRDGGYVRRRDLDGEPVILRQREVCDSVAPRTMTPGVVDPRPAWPAERAARVLRSKG